MENKCKNCKFWHRGYTTTDIPSELIEYYGECSCPKFVYQNPSYEEKDNVVYMDSEGLQATFDVGEDFGCIHFERVEDK